MNGRRMDPRQHSRVMMQQQALMRSQLAQAAANMPQEPLNSYVLSWHGHGGGPQHGGRGSVAGPGPIPSLSSGQGFYTVESLQGATAMPIPHNGPGLLGMGGPMLQPGFESHHQLPMVMHPMMGHKVLTNGMGFPQGAAAGSMVRMPGPEPPHMFGNAPQPHHLFVQNRLPQGYPHARRDVGPMFFSRERERDRLRGRDRDRDRDRERSRDRGRVRDRERERDRDRERERDRDRDRERERGREPDRDRDREEDRESQQKFHTRSKRGRVKQASPPLNPELPVPKPTSSSAKAKRKQPSALGPGGPGWCCLCQVECNTEEMLEQHVAGKRHKRHLQKLDGDQEGAKKKHLFPSEVKSGDDLAGDSDLVVQEGSNLVKKGSNEDVGGEEKTAKKPRLEDSDSEIGTLDLSSTMEIEQSSKLNEVCSRLDGEYLDDEGEPVEDDGEHSAILTNIQAIGGSMECIVSTCVQQEAAEDVNSGVGNITDDPSVPELLSDVNEKPAYKHTEAAGCKDSLGQALCLDLQHFDLENIRDDEKVLESDDEWNEEGVSPSEKLLVDETVLPDEDLIELTIHPVDEKIVHSEDALELLDYDDLLTDEECLDVNDTEFAYDDVKPQKQLEREMGLLADSNRHRTPDKTGNGLCDISLVAEVVANRKTALRDALKPLVTADDENLLPDVAVIDAQAPLKANLILDGDIALDDHDEFVVRGNAMRISVSAFGDRPADMRDLHVYEGDSMYHDESESSGDTILLGESSMDTEQPFDDEVTLICEEISHCDSLFDEDEELDDPEESLSVSEAKDMADFETYTDISNNLDAENPIDRLDVGCDSEIAMKDEIVLLFGSPLKAGTAGNGLTAGNTALVKMFGERVSDSDSSENLTRDGGDAVCVKILPSGESHSILLHEISSADKADDAGSFAERLSTGDCIENPSPAGGENGNGDESSGPSTESLLNSQDRNPIKVDTETVEPDCQTEKELVQHGGIGDPVPIRAL